MQIAESFTDWLIEHGANRSDRDIYIYGIECFANEFLADALLLFIGAMADRLFITIIWLFFFTAIRTQLGGFHASTHLRCILGSTVIGTICIFTYPLFASYQLWMLLFSVFSLVVIIKIAPVVHKNHPISKDRIKHVRRRAIAVGSMELVVITGCLFHYPDFAGIVFLALLSAAILGLLPVKKSQHQNYNQNGE